MAFNSLYLRDHSNYALFLDKFERLRNKLLDLGVGMAKPKLVEILFAKANVKQMGTNVRLAYVVELGNKPDQITLEFATEKI